MSAEVETPVAFVPKDPPAATVDTRPPSIPQHVEPPSVLYDVESSSGTLVDVPTDTVSSPSSNIPTVSDLTPAEPGEEIEQTTTRCDMFYFEDGNVEIVCENAVFRVHSTVISFSSSELRDVLSPPALLRAPTPEGRPRITIQESAEDFGVLLKMIYTPGWVSFPFHAVGGCLTCDQIPCTTGGSGVHCIRVTPSHGNEVRLLRHP